MVLTVDTFFAFEVLGKRLFVGPWFGNRTAGSGLWRAVPATWGPSYEPDRPQPRPRGTIAGGAGIAAIAAEEREIAALERELAAYERENAEDARLRAAAGQAAAAGSSRRARVSGPCGCTCK